MSTPRMIACPTCHGNFAVGQGLISVCPRCGERVLVPSLEGDDDLVQTPAKESPEISSVRVQCKLCNSRYYAKPAQIGQVLKCPDCFTNNVVPAPDADPEVATPEPLSDEDDFKLSAPVDTPRYQALAKDALEFERAIRSADGLQVRPLDVPAAPVQPPQQSQPTARASVPSPSASAPQEEDDDGFILLEATPGAPTSRPPVTEQPTEPLRMDDGDFELLDNSTAPSASTPSDSTHSPTAPQAASTAEEPSSSDDFELFPEDRARPPAHKPAPAPTPLPPRRGAPPPVATTHDEDDDAAEVPLSKAVDRVEYRPVVQLPPADPVKDDDDGSEFNAGKFGAAIKKFLPEGRGPEMSPELMAKRPFSAGIFNFLLQPAVLGRWVGLTLLVIIELWAMQVIFEAVSTGGFAWLGALLIYLMAFIPALLGLVAAAMFCLTIFQDTANGHDRIESWPDFGFFEWGITMVYFLAAFFVAGLPGALFGTVLGQIAYLYVLSPLLLLASLVLLFPPVFISILEAGTITEPISKTMIRSYLPLTKFWVTFYLLSLAVAAVGVGAVLLSLLLQWGLIVLIPASIVLTALPFLYFRLLGRMAMVYRDYVFSLPADEETSPARATG